MFLFDGTAAQSTPIIGVLLTLVRAAWLALSEQHNDITKILLVFTI